MVQSCSSFRMVVVVMVVEHCFPDKNTALGTRLMSACKGVAGKNKPSYGANEWMEYWAVVLPQVLTATATKGCQGPGKHNICSKEEPVNLLFKFCDISSAIRKKSFQACLPLLVFLEARDRPQPSPLQHPPLLHTRTFPLQCQCSLVYVASMFR